MVGFKARVQRTGFQVVLARVGGRVARAGRESPGAQERERVAHWRVVLNSPIWPRPQAAARISVSVWGGAPPMSMVSDDFGLRYLIFHSFCERYTQALISVVNIHYDAKV